MSISAGDTLEITFSNQNLGDRRFAVKADEEITFDLGGYNAETQPNGNGTAVDKLNRAIWKLEGLMLQIDLKSGDLEYINKLAGDPLTTKITWEHITGAIYSMSGRPNGELKYNSNTGYLPLTLAGGGTPKQIA